MKWILFRSKKCSYERISVKFQFHSFTVLSVELNSHIFVILFLSLLSGIIAFLTVEKLVRIFRSKEGGHGHSHSHSQPRKDETKLKKDDKDKRSDISSAEVFDSQFQLTVKWIMLRNLSVQTDPSRFAQTGKGKSV